MIMIMAASRTLASPQLPVLDSVGQRRIVLILDGGTGDSGRGGKTWSRESGLKSDY